MSDLLTAVSREVMRHLDVDNDGEPYITMGGPEAIVAVTLDWLAERADAEGLALVERQAIPGSYLVHEGGDVSAWIRAQTPEGVTHEQ